MNNDVWVQKYRSIKLDNIIAHENIINLIKKFIDTNQEVPNLLFYGPPGTLKTTTAIAMANELYGVYFTSMVMMINASNERGIEVVRQKIKQFSLVSSLHGLKNKKLIILDEMDIMTRDAQEKLKYILDSTYENNVSICLICNNIQNVDPALQSWCVKLRFAPLDSHSIMKAILHVIFKESLLFKFSGVKTLIKYSNGDLRKAINNLQGISMCSDIIDDENVREYLSIPNDKIIANIISSSECDDMKSSYENILRIFDMEGYSIVDIIKAIYDYIIELIDENTMRQIAFIIKTLGDLYCDQMILKADKIFIPKLIASLKKAKII